MSDLIYLDNAATTALDERVLQKMLPYLQGEYGNASSQHAMGRRASAAVMLARDKIASILGCTPEEVYFTSGGTEADNWALRGIYGANKGGHILLSAIEHPALISCAEDLRAQGADISYVYPDSSGIVQPEFVEKALKDNTVFVGVMSANNETGVIQPTKEIASLCRSRGIFYYSDCVQSAGVLPFDIENTGGIGFSAHKFYGPKGVGVAYLKKGSAITRLLSGGMQERGMRGGTTFVAGIVGLAEALSLAMENRDENNRKVRSLRDSFLDRVLSEVEGVSLNGDRKKRLPANANLAFEGVTGDQMVMLLDMRGVCVSAGSACAAGATTPSYVLTAMGLDEKVAKSSVRFTFGKNNTFDEVERTVQAIKEILNRVRG